MKRWILLSLAGSTMGLTLASGSSLDQALRVNARADIVLQPGGLYSQRLSTDGDLLYVAWTSYESHQTNVAVAKVDLSAMTRLESVQLTEGRAELGKGFRQVSDISAAGGVVDVAWMEAEFRAGDRYYFLNILTLDELKVPTSPPQRFEYGVQLTHPQFVKTPQGLFLVGSSIASKGVPSSIRLYRRDDQTWTPVSLGGDEGQTGRDVFLRTSGKSLVLGWCDGEGIGYRRSTNGRDWSKPVRASDRRAASLRAADAPDGGIYLAWSEYENGMADVWSAEIPESGDPAPPRRTTQIANASQLHLTLAARAGGEREIVFSYRDRASKSAGVGRVFEHAGGWTFQKLVEPARGNAVHEAPSIESLGDSLYTAWSLSNTRDPFLKIPVVYSALLPEGTQGKSEPQRVVEKAEGSFTGAFSPMLISRGGSLYVCYYTSDSTQYYRVMDESQALWGNRTKQGDLHLQRIATPPVGKAEN